VNPSSYPSRQPFPKNPVVRVGPSKNSNAREDTLLPTYPFPPYDDAQREMTSYLDSRTRGDSFGATIGIKGSAGSGKTHLIDYLMKFARTKMPTYEVYVKAESTNIVDLYSKAIEFLGRNSLVEMQTALLSQLARNELLSNDLRSEVSEPLAEELDRDPGSVYSFLQSRILSTWTLFAAGNDILQGNKSYFDNYLRAFSYLRHDALSEQAFDWFCGKTLPLETMQSIGVRRNIVDAPAAITGFQFLIAVFSTMKRPFLIFIDQIERLVLDAEPALCAVNKGYLHSLMELVYDANGFLCLAGMIKAWEALPNDFLQRLSTPPFKMPSLSVELTLRLVNIYLRPREVTPEYGSETDIYPFTELAIYEVTKLGRGNIRAILSLCNRSFENAEPNHETVTPQIVRKAAEQLKRVFDRANVLIQAKLILKQLNFDCAQAVTVDGTIRIDIAVPDMTAPRLLIDVSEPNFSDDEARAAIQYVTMANVIRAKWPDAKIMVIEAGYVSAEVQETLRPFLDAHILYNPDEFEAEFTGAVQILTKPSDLATKAGTQPKALAESALEEKLRQILELRAEEQRNISYNISQALSDQHTKAPGRFTIQITLVAAISIASAILIGMLSWTQGQREQTLATTRFQAQQTEIAARKESVNLLTSIQEDSKFDAAKNSFSNLARQPPDFLAKGQSAQDKVRELRDSYDTIRRSYMRVAQCAIAGLCDSRVLCEGIGDDVKQFVHETDAFSVKELLGQVNDRALSSFISHCGLADSKGVSD
jgi:Cdc6-like AAA superfamily ATPase